MTALHRLVRKLLSLNWSDAEIHALLRRIERNRLQQVIDDARQMDKK